MARATFPMTCAYEHCKRAFEAHRTTARFCSDECRARHCHEKKDPRRRLRPLILDRFNHCCCDCGLSNCKLVVVYNPPYQITLETGFPLCFSCVRLRSHANVS